MRRILVLVQFVFFFAGIAIAQIPAPQINLTGNIGCQGFPCVNTGTLVLASDANHTMTAQETSAFYIRVTSSVSLTATRNLIFPSGRFPVGIENATTGGQTLNACGPSGACVSIPNSTTTFTPVWNDGTNFVSGSSSGGGSGTINMAAQYSNPYYSGAGSSSTLSGVAFNGIPQFSTTAAPSAANANNVAAPTNCVAASGSSTAYTCTTSPSTTIANNTTINFVPDVTTGINPTLSVNGATAAPIYQQQGAVQVTATDMLAGYPVQLTWNAASGYWLAPGIQALSAGKINGVFIPQNAIILGSGPGATSATIISQLSGTPAQTAVYMTAMTPGTGVTVAPTLSLVGGTCSTPPVLIQVITGGFVDYITQTAIGVCTVVPTVSLSGGTYTTLPTATLSFANTIPEINNYATTPAGMSFDYGTGAGPVVMQNFPYLVSPLTRGLTVGQFPGGNPASLVLSPSNTPGSGCSLNSANGTLIYLNCTLNAGPATLGGSNLLTSGEVGTGTQEQIVFAPTSLGKYVPFIPNGLQWNTGISGGVTPALAGYSVGGGYTGTPTCNVVGGTLTSGAAWTCGATLTSGQITVTSFSGTGTYSVLPTITVTGVSGGGGFYQIVGTATAPAASESMWGDPTGVIAFGGGTFNLGSAWMKIASTGVTIPTLSVTNATCSGTCTGFGGGGGSFSALTSGTNTTAAMQVGTGASLGYTGTGTVNANQILGNTVPALASGNLNWSGSAWQFVAGGGGLSGMTAGQIPVAATSTTATSSVPFINAGGDTLHAKLQFRKTFSNQANTKVCLVGDSIMFGISTPLGSTTFEQGTVPQLATALAVNYGIPVYWDSFFGTGVISGTPNYALYDNRISMGSSWSGDYTNLVPGGGSYAATTSTNALSFTPADPVNTFNVYYLTNTSAGTFQATCTNCTTTTQSESGTQGIGKLTLTATGAAAINTVNLTWYSGGQVNIWGVEAYDSTRPAVLLESMGEGSAQSTQWANTTNAYGPGNSLPYSTVGCDLTTYQDGINDLEHGVTIPTFTSNSQTFISAVIAAGSDVVLEAAPPVSTYSIASQKPYLQAMQSLAYANSNNGLVGVQLPIIDTWDSFAGPISGATYGWSYSNAQGREATDGIHLSTFGYGYFAHLMASCFFTYPCQSDVTNDLAYTPYLTPAKITITQTGTTNTGLTFTDGTYTEGYLGSTCGSGQCTGLQLSANGTTNVNLDGYRGSYFVSATGEGGVSIGSTTLPAANTLSITNTTGTPAFQMTNGTNNVVKLGGVSGGDNGTLTLSMAGATNVSISAYSGSYFNSTNAGLTVGGTVLPSTGSIESISATTNHGFIMNNGTNNVAVLTGFAGANDGGTLNLYYAGVQVGALIGYNASNDSYLPGGFTAKGTDGLMAGVVGTNVGKLTLYSATAGGSTQLAPTAGVSTAVVLTLPGATDTLAGIAATQTLTNKSIALTEVNSGLTAGGFMTASSTTVPTMMAYTAYAIPKMASTATTAVISSILDNATDVVTTEPLYSSNGNQLNGTTATAITSTSFVTTGIAFPPTYATTARPYRGICHVVWQQLTAVATVQFGINTSTAPTHMTLNSVSYVGTTAVPFSNSPTDITSATTTAATGSLTAGVIATNYITEIDVVLSAGAAANTVTLYGLTSVTGDTLNIMPGTYCTWLP